jgi:hypothetical protein
MRFDNFEQEYRFQKTTKTNQDKPKRQDEGKSKERKKDYSQQRQFKRGEQ